MEAVSNTAGSQLSCIDTYTVDENDTEVSGIGVDRGPGEDVGALGRDAENPLSRRPPHDAQTLANSQLGSRSLHHEEK